MYLYLQQKGKLVFKVVICVLLFAHVTVQNVFIRTLVEEKIPRAFPQA